MPEIGTDDMAYYCFAFKINKKYSEVEIDSKKITL